MRLAVAARTRMGGTKRNDPPRRAARKAGLRYVEADEPGFARVRRRGGFAYRTASGAPLRSAAHLARIRALAIPPAWEAVWICRDARGHLQATGRDARGRKQYRYHALWRETRDAAKFASLVAFGAALPRLRRRVDAGLSLPGVPREKVLATIVRILDRGAVRIGNRAYAEENGTYGLTTLLCRHARVEGARVRLGFRGKSGQPRRVALEGRRLARAVRACLDLPGQRLFRYVDDDGVARDVRSEHVNQWLRDATDLDATAKTFRTWRASALAAGLLARAPVPASAARRERVARGVIEAVARELGNTPAVCKRCYVLPALLEEFVAGRPPRRFARGRAGLTADERALLAVLARGSGAARAPRAARPSTPARGGSRRGRAAIKVPA